MLPLDTVKSLLGIADDSQDGVLQYVMDSVEESICNYCNLDQVPSGLFNTAFHMAVDMYRQEGFGSLGTPQGPVASISEGDTSVSFKDSTATKAYDAYATSVLKNYTMQLNRYRRMRSPCPCCHP